MLLPQDAHMLVLGHFTKYCIYVCCCDKLHEKSNSRERKGIMAHGLRYTFHYSIEVMSMGT